MNKVATAEPRRKPKNPAFYIRCSPELYRAFQVASEMDDSSISRLGRILIAKYCVKVGTLAQEAIANIADEPGE